MPVDRADIVEAEFLEQRTRYDHALDVFFGAPCQLQYRRHFTQYFFTGAAGCRVKAPGHELGQVVVERADVGRNRHVVVVEDHQQVGVDVAGVVERLERHARSHRAVADDRHGATYQSGALGRHRHAQRGGNRSAGMAGTKGVVRAFFALGKARDTVGFAQARHGRTPSGEDFVRIALVADVPHQAVIRRIEYIMECNGQLDRAEVRGQVAAGLRHAIENETAQLFGQRSELVARHTAQVSG